MGLSCLAFRCDGLDEDLELTIDVVARNLTVESFQYGSTLIVMPLGCTPICSGVIKWLRILSESSASALPGRLTRCLGKDQINKGHQTNLSPLEDTGAMSPENDGDAQAVHTWV
jgi:hypothetical protein